MRIATATMGTTTATAVLPPEDNPEDFCVDAPPDTKDPAEEEVVDEAELVEDVGACVGGGAAGSVEVMTTTIGVPPWVVGPSVMRDVTTGAEMTEVVPGLIDVLEKTEEIVVGEDDVSEGVMVLTGAVVKEVKVDGGMVEVEIGIEVNGDGEDDEVSPIGEAVLCQSLIASRYTLHIVTKGLTG